MNYVHNKPLQQKQFSDSCSLLNNLSNLLKILPQNFEISTNNGEYCFNKNLSCIIFPVISIAINNDKSLSQFHFKIDDELEIMKRMESLFKGESVDFYKSEEKEIKKIIKLFIDQIFSTNFNPNSDLSKDSQDKMSLEINSRHLFDLLQQNLPLTFKIKTTKNEFNCNSLGILSSKVISAFLKLNPDSMEYNFDFNCENSEFQPISDFFNFKEIKITSENIDTLQTIAESLEITPIIDLNNEIYEKYDENFQKSTENLIIIEPYNELFEKLFKIKIIGIQEVAEFILNSEWVKSKSEIKELIACIFHIIKTDIFLHQEILDLIILLSKNQDQFEDLSILIPFLTTKIFNYLCKSNNISSFLYHLYCKNLVSIDLIIKKISLFYSSKNALYNIKMLSEKAISDNSMIYSPIIWFFPELLEHDFLDENLQLIKKCVPYIDADETDIERMKKLRENYIEKDSIILSIKNDDVDTFQSIISKGEIDIQHRKIKTNIFENLYGEVTFIDYAAACGSTKCFKYLLLNDAMINYNTFSCSILGGNVEIIRIIDQNKNNFTIMPNKLRFYSPNDSQNPIVAVFKTAILKHEYKIFDWLLDQNVFESEKDLINLLKYSISCGNVHSMTEIINKFSNLNNLNNLELYGIINEACQNGFYKILLFLTRLIQIHDLTDPTKGDHSDLKDISNRRLKIKNLNSLLIQNSISYGNLSIFELILNETGIKNSCCLFEGLIKAIQINSLEIVKYILDNKLYELTPYFMIKSLQQSIKNDSEDVTNYLFEKEMIINNEILESACFIQNIKLVKFLVQKAAEKQISLDFTEPFIKAINLFSDEICRYFIELKVTFNYQRIFDCLYEIIETNPKTVILLIENADDEIKDDLITQSINSAITLKNTKLLEYFFKKGSNLNGLLLWAIEKSNLQTVKTILDYNQTPEFINQIGPKGTALHEAIYFYKNDIIEYLLQLKGIDPNISVDSIQTPLVEAVESNNLEAVELILKFYGDSIKDQSYQIHNAFNKIISKQSRRIEEKKRNLNGHNFRFMFGRINNTENEKKIFKLLVEVKKKLNPINMIEEDLLSYAILEKDEKIVENLIEIESTDLKRRLQNGDTYLHLAIDGSEITPVQKLLINHPDVDINSQNVLSETPLTKAIKNGNTELVDLILSHPKFDHQLSLLDYAFFLSVSSKNLSRKLLNEKNLDVNFHHKSDQNERLKITPLMEAIRLNDMELAELIINHPSFDPSKSKIKSCLFNSVRCKNLNLFKFLLKMNGNEINIKNERNTSLLGYAASIKDNYEILNEILNNENFDPVKSDIQKSFLIANDLKIMKILISYDEKHLNCLSFDKINILFHLNATNQAFDQCPSHSIQFLLRKKEIVPKIHPICTLVISKQSKLNQQLYRCKTCLIDNICEICARVCHKDHEIQIMTNKTSQKEQCHCSTIGHQCKCMSTETCSDDEEIYMRFPFTKSDDVNRYSFNTVNQNHFDNHLDNGADAEYEYDYYDDIAAGVVADYQNQLVISNNNNDNKNHDFDDLRCSLDLSGYNPILQIMYFCKKCQAEVCQNCAIRCHKDHPLQYLGLCNDSLCYCKDICDCKCTDRKGVICSYLFYGTEYILQPWFKCITCGTMTTNKGCCAVCSKVCHKGHKVISDGKTSSFCDCGSDDLKSICKCMKFPPFNYLTCCTNRNQNYVIQKQRLYHCLTCGVTSKGQGICESCAIHCHIGHKLVFVGIDSFACECEITMNYTRKMKCISCLCPEMNLNGKCKRSNKNPDAIFGKYICYTCDKEGKIELCESCAVKCHKNHDVHFIEFSNFECQCGHC